MAETPITRPHSLQWPLSEQQVEDLNATIDDIYELLRQRKAADAPAHTLLSDVHTDTTPADEVDGDLIVGQGGAFGRKAKGTTNGHVLEMVAGAPEWSANGASLEDLNADEITSGTLAAARLALSGVTAGTYGDASHVPQVTVDNKGRVTAAVDVAIATTHNLLSTTHPDTSPASPQLGDLVVAQNSGALDVAKYYVDGQPFDYLPNANDNGTEKFWIDGLPGAGLVSSGAVLWARKALSTPGYVWTAGATGPDWQPASSGGVGVSGYRSSDFSVTEATITPVALEVMTFDDASFWSSGDPTKLTVPADRGGTYVVIGQLTMEFFVGEFWASLRVNGTERARDGPAANFGYSVASGAQGGASVAAVLRLTAGDYVQLCAEWYFSYAGGSRLGRGGSAKTFLQLVKVG